MSAWPSMEPGQERAWPCAQRLLKEAEKMKGSNEAGLEQKNFHAMEMARLSLPRANRPCKEETKASVHTDLCYMTRCPFSRLLWSSLHPKGAALPCYRQSRHRDMK